MWPWLPKPILFMFGNTRKLQLIWENSGTIFKTYYFWKYRSIKQQTIWKLLERRVPEKIGDPFKMFLKIWNVESISSKKHDMQFLDLGSFENLKVRNFESLFSVRETLKLRKLWNFENLELWNFYFHWRESPHPEFHICFGVTFVGPKHRRRNIQWLLGRAWTKRRIM